MKIFNSLRELARNTHWQIVYSRSKEISGISLFENNTDFTPVQVAFLQWLEIYHSLEVDLAMKEPYITRDVIEDDIRCDAYLQLRDSKENKKDKEAPAENAENISHIPSVMFNSRK